MFGKCTLEIWCFNAECAPWQTKRFKDFDGQNQFDFTLANREIFALI